MENGLNQATNFALDIQGLLGQRKQCMGNREALSVALKETLPKYSNHQVSDKLKFSDGSVVVVTTTGFIVKVEISLDDLSVRFVGKAVNITHTGNLNLHEASGVCVAIRHTGGDHFDVDLDSNYRFGFEPYKMTERMVVGTLPWIIGERRMELA